MHNNLYCLCFEIVKVLNEQELWGWKCLTDVRKWEDWGSKKASVAQIYINYFSFVKYWCKFEWKKLWKYNSHVWFIKLCVLYFFYVLQRNEVSKTVSHFVMLTDLRKYLARFNISPAYWKNNTYVWNVVLCLFFVCTWNSKVLKDKTFDRTDLFGGLSGLTWLKWFLSTEHM